VIFLAREFEKRLIGAKRSIQGPRSVVPQIVGDDCDQLVDVHNGVRLIGGPLDDAVANRTPANGWGVFIHRVEARFVYTVATEQRDTFFDKGAVLVYVLFVILQTDRALVVIRALFRAAAVCLDSVTQSFGELVCVIECVLCRRPSRMTLQPAVEPHKLSRRQSAEHGAHAVRLEQKDTPDNLC